MKPSRYHSLTVIFLCALFASSVSAQTIIADPPEREKPHLVVTPVKPIANVDNVIVQVMIGTASNSCMAPTFSDLSFTIEQLIEVEPHRDITVARYIVKVKFTQDPTPADKVCTMVYAPVDYGPKYLLGKLRAGSYQVVYDGPNLTHDPVIYGEFLVSESAIPLTYTIKGTVIDDPYPLKRASMPVANATVYLTQTAIPVTASESGSGRIAPIAPRDSAITDENGNYSFAKVSAGAYTMTCTHPDYRTVSLSVMIRKDTVINFTLVSADAYATVTGLVTLIEADVARPKPVEGCTIIVEQPQLISIASTTESSAAAIVSLRAITGADGRYTIDKVPITANGELWGVYAFYDGNIAGKRVALYNMRTDTVDFTFSTPYENSASVNVDGVVFTTAADKFVYQEKESVRIRYSITNTTTVTKTFGPFSQGCEYDLIVTGVADKEVYRASIQPICVDMLSEITVKPGETVIHDFPAWYMSNVKQVVSAEAIVAPRSVTLRFSARLQGAKYDNTLVGVPVTIELEPPAGVMSAAHGISRAAVAYNARQEQLALNLDKAQTVTIAVYTLNGAALPVRSRSTRFPAGIHTLSLQNVLQGRGLYIIGVKGAGFEKRFSVLHVGK